jgi:hypothetical protein
MAGLSYAVGPIDAGGALTTDLAMPAAMPLDQAAPVIERDRTVMATRPGMRQKHLPIRIEPETGNVLSGGRYLFDTAENAERYKSWLENEVVLDGTRFFDRPYFLNPVCHAWQVIGAHDLADIHTSHVVVRSERWTLSGADPQAALEQAWPVVLAEAGQRGVTSVWLLYQESEQLAGLVTVADRVGPASPQEPDFASLLALESAPSLGRGLTEQGWTKVFDRTSWVLTLWLPLDAAAGRAPSLWPNSPPLPAPAPEPAPVG